jgi:hypothetical protein
LTPDVISVPHDGERAMTTRETPDDVRVVYHREGLTSSSGHVVRSKMEGKVCEWLTMNGVSHKHGGEVFIVKSGPSHVAHLYVPDIILNQKSRKGKTVIIECFLTSEPKDGGARLLSDFKKQAGEKYHIVLIVKSEHSPKGIRGTANASVPFEKLDLLVKELR